ncbi:MAG: hypothetical protein M1831_001862 [Alyxoria varia]|nr:MAG: hypothetical protein M1831_001862 [Alyxoria varia]
MTSTEKWVLNSFLFLTVSLVLIASSLYLPSHISTVTSRAFYYWSGGNTGATFYNFTKNPIGTTSEKILHASELVASNAQGLASNAQVLATKGSNLAKGMMGAATGDDSNSWSHQDPFATAASD